jgi:hypothetical protein
MSSTPETQSKQASAQSAEIPDRLCTWCKMPMNKRLVADGRFIHYTCPKCVFQHSAKREPQKE